MLRWRRGLDNAIARNHFVLAAHFEDDSALLDADETIRSIRHLLELAGFVCFRVYVLAKHEDEKTLILVPFSACGPAGRNTSCIALVPLLIPPMRI